MKLPIKKESKQQKKKKKRNKYVERCNLIARPKRIHYHL